LAIIFNIPRIIVLTIFGIVVGIISYVITQEYLKSAIEPFILNIQLVGYGFLGIFILAFGAHMFVTSVESKEDIKEGKKTKISCQKECKVKSKKETECAPQRQRLFGLIQRKFNTLQGKPNTLFLIWGGILSIACLGEIALIELSMISGSLGIASNSLFGAAFLGGSGMFFFAVGAAIPLILVSVASSSISKYIKTIEKLESIRTIGAMVMIMIGLVFIIMLAAFILSNI